MRTPTRGRRESIFAPTGLDLASENELNQAVSLVELFQKLRFYEIGDDAPDNFSGPVGNAIPAHLETGSIASLPRSSFVVHNGPVVPSSEKLQTVSSVSCEFSDMSPEDLHIELDSPHRGVSSAKLDDDVMFPQELDADELFSPDEITSPRPSLVAGSSKDEEPSMVPSPFALGTCYRHGLVGKDFRAAIVAATPKKAMAKAAKEYMLGRGPAAYRKAVVGPIFNSHNGLERLYRMFVDHCREEIGRCMRAIAAEIEYPFVVYCNHGKDRTGMICALIHHVCGVPRPQIIANYAISDEKLEPIAALTEDEMRSGGLDPSILCRSPARAMEATFEYIEETFGDVETYLSTIGFGPQYQSQLRSKLVEAFEVAPLQLPNEPQPDAVPQPGALPSFTPADADSNGLVSLPPLSPCIFAGSLPPGSYQLSIEAVDLYANEDASVHCFFALGISGSEQYKVLSTLTLHQSSTTTLTRPFVVPAVFSDTPWSLTVTGFAPPTLFLSRARISIRPFPASSEQLLLPNSVPLTTTPDLIGEPHEDLSDISD